MFSLSANVWTAGKCIKQIKSGMVTLDNACQRGEVWDNKKKSLFIHSAIVGFPTQKMFASKIDGTYDMLDGKQRLSALRDYIDGEFKLSPVPKVWVKAKDGEKEISVNGKKFHELPEALQDSLTEYNIDICSIENATEDEVSEIFTRLNSGKSLTSFEVVRGKIPALDTIKEIAKHPVFERVLTKKEFNRLDADEIVIKSWIALFEETPNFTALHIRSLAPTLEIAEEQKQTVLDCYDKFNSVYEQCNEEVQDKITRKTNFLSLMSLFKDNNEEILIQLCNNFYTTGTSVASINEEYNACVLQGSTNQSKTIRRVEILNEYINQF